MWVKRDGVLTLVAAEERSEAAIGCEAAANPGTAVDQINT